MYDSGQPVYDRRRYLANRAGVDAILVSRLYSQIPLESVFYLFYPLVLLYVTQDAPEFVIATAWSGAVYILIGIRLYLYHEHRQGSDRFPDHRGWAAAATLSSAVAGILTGISVVILFDIAVPGVFLFAVAFIVGLVSASLNLTAQWMPAQAAFTMPTALVPAARLAFESGWLATLVAVLLLLFLVLAQLLARTINHRAIAEVLLEQENEELVRTLTAERNRANAANSAKSRFLASASHDLRQPIHALNLLLESLHHARDEREREQTIIKIERTTAALAGLLDALLDISRLDAGGLPVELRTVALHQVVEPLLRQYSPEAERKGLSLAGHGLGQHVVTDPTLLGRVVSNLLANAIKFTDRGAVEVRADDDGSAVRLHIVDTGSGIESGNLDRVFDEFFQEHNPNRDRSQGIGLGLAICRRICDLLQHPIALRSTPGKGTEVTITLPIGDAAERAADAPAEQQGLDSAAAQRVLVVEDDLLVAEALAELFDRWQWDARMEADAETALAVLDRAEFVPDAVISDLRLPGAMDGLQLVSRIRERYGDRLPCVIVTGDTDPQRLAEVRAAGVRVLFKPLQPARLRSALQRVQPPAAAD